MTNSRQMFIKGKDGQEIFLRIWDNVTKPKGVVQIFHGMANIVEGMKILRTF